MKHLTLRSNFLSTILKRLARAESGQDLIEYALLCAFVAIAAAWLLMSIGSNVNSTYGDINASVSAAGQSAAGASGTSSGGGGGTQSGTSGSGGSSGSSGSGGSGASGSGGSQTGTSGTGPGDSSGQSGSGGGSGGGDDKKNKIPPAGAPQGPQQP